MQQETTKERIVTEAVKLFSKIGYEAATVEQIATVVGIKAPSLYKHYKSKKDIFDSILKRKTQEDSNIVKENMIPEGPISEIAKEYVKTPLETIKAYSETLFLHWTEEEFSCAFRRMLTIEQFRNQEMMELYQQYLVAGPIEYMTDLFAKMTNDVVSGKQLALEFYSPMFLLYSMYDATNGIEKKQEIVELLHNHVDRFAKRLEIDYGIK